MSKVLIVANTGLQVQVMLPIKGETKRKKMGLERDLGFFFYLLEWGSVMGNRLVGEWFRWWFWGVGDSGGGGFWFRLGACG